MPVYHPHFVHLIPLLMILGINVLPLSLSGCLQQREKRKRRGRGRGKRWRESLLTGACCCMAACWAADHHHQQQQQKPRVQARIHHSFSSLSLSKVSRRLFHRHTLSLSLSLSLSSSAAFTSPFGGGGGVGSIALFALAIAAIYHRRQHSIHCRRIEC